MLFVKYEFNYIICTILSAILHKKYGASLLLLNRQNNTLLSDILILPIIISNYILNFTE